MDIIKVRPGTSGGIRPAAVERYTECELCRKTFGGPNRRSHLQRHMMIHTGEKPYACPHCSHKTSRSENLRLHLRLKHPELFVNTTLLTEHPF